MAIYHLSAQVISRGFGHSAVHAAAYRGRCELTDERTGLVHDYSRKAGELLFEGIYAPKDAPAWAHDRAQLWNHVEAFEKHRRAELAREFNIALPHELTLEQNRYALQDWIRDNFTRKGLIADAAIHAPGRDGDQRNMHAHVMVVMRKLDGSEFARTKERFETFSEKEAAKKAELENLRESWERIGNRHLERYGHAPSLDRRSLLAQGVEREPSLHMGKSATAIERKGHGPSELGEVNREIKAGNERRVIDLAAERAMREARDAARGRVDDVRPGNSVSRTESTRTPPKVQPKFAREAVRTHETAAAPIAPGPWGTRTTDAQRVAQRDTGKTVAVTGNTVSKGAGILGRGILSVFAGLLKMFDLFPAKPPSPEQQQRNRQAAKEQQATDELKAEKDVALRQILERISRDDQERARQRRERGGRDDDDRGRDRGYER
jgi:hypothetical protein